MCSQTRNAVGELDQGRTGGNFSAFPRLSKLVVAANPRVYMYVIIKILK